MSLFSGAQCSTSKNPLSQLSGQGVSKDTSLHNQFSNTTSAATLGNAMVNNKQMNRADASHMNQFFGHSNTMASSHQSQSSSAFDMAPINHELMNMTVALSMSLLTHPNSSNNSTFRSLSASPPAQILPQKHHNSQQAMGARTGNWSNEFQLKNSSSSSLTTTNTATTHHMSGNTMQYQPRFMHTFRFANSAAKIPQHQLVPQQDLQQNQHQEVNWDDQFQNIEKSLAFDQEQETSESKEESEANTKEDALDSLLGDTTNAEFDRIWKEVNEANHNSGIDSLLTDNNATTFEQYTFAENNPFLEYQDSAYDIGLQLLESGAKLSEVALAFEAAVKQKPDHLDAWIKLGEVQAANEKEMASLQAYTQALKLDPSNLKSLLNSAISYINEGRERTAVNNLKKWLFIKYPKSQEFYNNLTQHNGDVNNIEHNTDEMNEFYTSKEADDVISTYLNFIRNENAAVHSDADFQISLGALYFSQTDFDKTTDCFRAALQIDPENEILWSRLGASLANSGRSEEAISAYRKALQIRPSFVRARYNLAISCLNIGCHKEAAEHLLAGLSLHKVDGTHGKDYDDGKIFDLSNSQSDGMLESLRRSFYLLERKDLMNKVSPNMDLEQFRGEFSF